MVYNCCVAIIAIVFSSEVRFLLTSLCCPCAALPLRHTHLYQPIQKSININLLDLTFFEVFQTENVTFLYHLQYSSMVSTSDVKSST